MKDSLNPSGEPLNLPAPQVETTPFKVEGGNVDEVVSELAGSKSTELGATVQPVITQPDPSSIATPPDARAKLAQITAQPAPDPSAPVSASPTMADDEDLIEKEWVDKAKQIVERNKNDPHAQNKEIGLYKAEYMKKRFNKDIKTTES